MSRKVCIAGGAVTPFDYPMHMLIGKGVQKKCKLPQLMETFVWLYSLER